MPPPVFSLIAYPSIGIHRGAIDKTMISTKAPPEVMRRVRTALDKLGVAVEEESEWRYRCVRPRRADNEPDKEEQAFEDTGDTNTLNTRSVSVDASNATDVPTDTARDPEEPPPSIPLPQATHGPHTQDPGGEVRFFVELTRLDRLPGTYSLDIRRLRGNLRSYKFIYDSLRATTDLES